MPYFAGKSKTLPAELNRYLIEMDLIQRFHWTPQEIAKIPYKWIQQFYFISKVRNEAVTTAQETKKILAPYQGKTSSKAGTRKGGRRR